MEKHPGLELPIRSKIAMLEDIIDAMEGLHRGLRKRIENSLKDLLLRALYLDEAIQQSALIFSEHVQFQYRYDPQHKVSEEIEKAADQLIENMGFSLSRIKKPPPSFSSPP